MYADMTRHDPYEKKCLAASYIITLLFIWQPYKRQREI